MSAFAAVTSVWEPDTIAAMSAGMVAVIGAVAAGIVQVHRTRSDVATLTDRMDAYEVELKTLRARETALVEDLRQAWALVGKRDERIAQLEDELADVRKRLDELGG